MSIADIGGIELLAQACAAVDRAEALAAVIAEDGMMVIAPSGARKLHPAIREERDTRAFVCRTLARLGITLEPKKPIGRPSGGLGWQPWKE
jgi:Phage terminase, small subunit